MSMSDQSEKSTHRKIVLVISSLHGGGAERVMSNLANYWAERGIRVTLVTLDNPLIDEAYSVIHPVKRCILYYPVGANIFQTLYAQGRRLLGLRDLLKAEKPDAVLSFMTPVNLLTILAATGTGVRSVVSERTNPEKYPYGPISNVLRRFLYRLSDCVVAQTDSIREWLEQKTDARVVTIPNYINVPGTDEDYLKEKIVIAVGRLGKEKGFDVLIKAFARLQHVYSDWRLVILGEGSERKELESLITSLELKDSVRLMGHVSSTDRWLKKAMIAVQPSRFEGFPNALLEAMAEGVAVVASHEAGNMLIDDGKNGFLVPSDDVETLANILERLFTNPALREELGKNAEKVRSVYSRKKIMMQWENVLYNTPITSNQ
jgi:GalNAc-alpha-(1->4)-GalNAc-alpha-(1->3)-diNAcBac-PP-undecaprenol alpha-1,4-N-acetyl-D-galactosaminyltransferase